MKKKYLVFGDKLSRENEETAYNEGNEKPFQNDSNEMERFDKMLDAMGNGILKGLLLSCFIVIIFAIVAAIIY